MLFPVRMPSLALNSGPGTYTPAEMEEKRQAECPLVLGKTHTDWPIPEASCPASTCH